MKWKIIWIFFVVLQNSSINCSDENAVCKTSSCELRIISANCRSTYLQEDCNTKTLRISDCGISNLTCFLSTFNHLEHLHASDNSMNAIGPKYFASVKNITDIDLSNNEIDSIDENAFDKADRLTKINLSHNHIRNLNSKTFSKLENLRSLDLSWNRFTTISLDFYPYYKIDLILSGAYCECICSIYSGYLDHNSIRFRINHYGCSECNIFEECICSNLYRIFRHSDFHIYGCRMGIRCIPRGRNDENSREITTAVATTRMSNNQKNAPRILFGMTQAELEILSIITVSVVSVVLVILFSLILRDYLDQKEKLKNRRNAVQKKASCRPDRIVRIKAEENPYILV